MDFLKVDPAEWEQRADYLAGLKIVKNLVVINDRSERAVAAMTKFLHKTKDEEMKQYLLKTVIQDREVLSDCDKKLFQKL